MTSKTDDPRHSTRAVLRGAAAAWRRDPRLAATAGVLNIISDGDHFGELALLHDQPRSATIRTLTPSLLMSMSQKQFLELVGSTPALARLLEARVESSYVHARPWSDNGRDASIQAGR